MRHRFWILPLLLLAAVGVRVAYFVQLNSGPLAAMHKWDQTDMGYYDAWARRICAGDWLSANIPLPFHFWHKQIAEKCFELDPTLRAELEQKTGGTQLELEQLANAAQADREQKAVQTNLEQMAAKAELKRDAKTTGKEVSPQQLLWQRWIGEKHTWQEPAYPYLIALTYLLLQPDQRWVFVWQMALGVISVWLMYEVTRRHFGEAAAVVAGLLLVFCRPLVMYEGLMLRDANMAYIGLLAVYLTDIALARQKARWWFLLGVSLGGSMLLKSVFACYLAALPLLLIVYYWRQWHALAISATALLLGAVIINSPWAVRNAAVGLPILAAPGGNAGVPMTNGNAVDITWDESNPVSESLAPIMLETGGKTLPAMRAALATHPNVWSIIGTIWNKFDAMWHWWERPDNVGSYFYEVYAPILGWLPVTFAVLSPLGLLGMVLAVPQLRRHAALYLLLATATAPLLIFLVLARFRLPLAVVAIPFGAHAAVTTVGWFWRRAWVKGSLALAAIVVLALWAGRPLPPSVALFRSCDYVAVMGFHYSEPVQQAYRAREWDRAADILSDLIRHEPPGLAELSPESKPNNVEDIFVATLMASANECCGSLRLASGDSAAARRHYAAALADWEYIGRWTPPAPR